MSKTFSAFSLCFIFLFVLLCQVNAGTTDPVTISDTALRAVIEAKLGKNSGDTITEGEMNGITTDISTFNKGIENLTGLEHATGVPSITFNLENIQSLTPLAGLTQLTSLSLYDNKTTLDLTPVEDLTNLETLVVQRNVFRSDAPSPITDISALKNLTKLKQLYLGGQRVSSLSTLSNKTALTELRLGNNRYEVTGSPLDISHLSNLTMLTKLDLSVCDVRDISHLSGLTSLKELDLEENKGLQNISAISNFTALEQLILRSTNITNAGLSAVLDDLSHLRWLNLSRTPVSDLSVIERLPEQTLNVLDVSQISESPTLSSDERGRALTDITPLVSLQQAGKITEDRDYYSGTPMNLLFNWHLDYDSIYTDIPVLIGAGIDIDYSPYVPNLQRISEEEGRGRPGTRYTFVVSAVNDGYWAGSVFATNPNFKGVPVTWAVTAPDGTQTETEAVTGDDGLARISVRLGSHGEQHTAEAVVPANAPANGPMHSELRISFTATSDSNAPITPDPTLPGLTVSFRDYPEAPPTDTFPLTIRFSEPVTGFQTDDIRVETKLTAGTGTATLQGLTPTTGPTQTYTATVRVPTDAVGTVRLVVRAGAALTTQGQIGPVRDTASEWIAFGQELTVSFRNYPEEPPTNKFPLTIRFSEPVNGFQADDISVETELAFGTGTAILQGLTPTTAPTQTYTATVSVPADAVGSVRLVVRASAAATTLGQIGPVRDTTSEWIAFSSLRALTVSFSDYPEEPPTNKFPLTIRFSKPVNGFQADDISVETELAFGTTGTAILQGLTPTTAPTQTYTATVSVPASAVGSVRLVVRARAVLTTQGQIGPVSDTASEWIAFSSLKSLTGPFSGYPEGPATDGGVSNLSIPVPSGGQLVIFNEIGNFHDDTNDWIELKNLCNTPLRLSEWEMRFMTTAHTETGTEKDVVSFPDFVLPAQAVLLITNTDPSATRLASGLNIATGARQQGAQHPYFVVPHLRLPSTPYLLILQRKVSANGGFRRTIEDMAGNYFWEMSPDGTEIYPHSYTPDSPEPTAPLTEVGAWQRWRSEQPGYLAAAWMSSGYQAHIGYDRRAPAALCLGTPGYVRDPSPAQQVTHRLVFNEIRNASDDTNDWIELKNISDTDIRLSDWEISIVLDAYQDVNIVSFPDDTWLPMDGVLLITNTDPSETVIADGLNIATGARQQGAQHPYLVAHGLKLPSTPYLLILRRTSEYGARTIEDVAGNYPFTETPSDGNPEIHLLPNASRPTEKLAPLTQFGAWQRRRLKQPGYLAAAWTSSGYHGHLGYDRHAPASACLGTPGYVRDPSPAQLVTHCLVFNKIHKASNNAGDYVDYIELKNVSDMDVPLSDWEVSIVASEGEAADEDVGIVSFPDYALPAGGTLLIINTDPGETVIRDVLNIATETQQKRTQRPYLVARALELPDTPYLLILRHARGKNGTPEAIEDVAGDYFRYDGDTQVWPLAYALHPSAPAAPLSEAGTYQRKDARQPGYLAAAWTANQSLPNYWYAPEKLAVQLVTRRLAFNKIRNVVNNANDYIELKNISDTVVRLRDWDISMVESENEAADEDVSIVSFPDYTLPVGGALLITNTDPDETVIIDGLNITSEAIGAGQQTGAQHPYFVAPNLKLPDTPYLLILRHARGKSGTREAIEDVAGNYFNNTEIWPLAYTRHPSAPAAPLSEAGTYQRKDARQPGYLAIAWTVNQSPPGLSDTPNALAGEENALFAPDAHVAPVVFNPNLPDEVRISELMSETQGPSSALPQWIELYNASPTPVDLEGWQLAIETCTDERHRHARLTLKTFALPPKQTVILVTGQGRRPGTLPASRVYDLSKAHADVFSRRLLKNTIIGTEGFCVELIHPTGRVVDTVGNLDGDKGTDDLPTWTLPDGNQTPQGHRFSLLRRFEGDVRKGTEAAGWMPAMAVAIGVNTYYGHPTDISTPGFLHQIVPGASPTTALNISEIMFASEMRTRPLPQWIELYNPSFTHSVKLKDYRLRVETRQEGNQHQQIAMTLEAFDVLPNQTVLLITEQGRHSPHLTDHLIYNLSQRHPKAFLSLPSRSHLLSSEGFLIQLMDATGNVVDTVGNLDGYPATEDAPTWALPPGETSDGRRASLRRLSEKQIPLDGRHAEAWVSTADVPPKIITYYGHTSDVGNPGYRKGGPLPVTLSSFSAAWRTDTVQITWTTESELDNAGFNILRSQTKEGEFQQINTQLIQGAGTTSERNAYTWTDTTAKPNTVYYYRIEDVSYAGERKQLTTVRIRGLVSPNGKRITRWADVKNQQ